MEPRRSIIVTCIKQQATKDTSFVNSTDDVIVEVQTKALCDLVKNRDSLATFLDLDEEDPTNLPVDLQIDEVFDFLKRVCSSTGKTQLSFTVMAFSFSVFSFFFTLFGAVFVSKRILDCFFRLTFVRFCRSFQRCCRSLYGRTWLNRCIDWIIPRIHSRLLLLS